jgi:hypothetical protein
MSALALYEQMLLGEEMKAVAQRAVVLAGHPEDTDFDDVIDHEDHPALAEALREWWRGLASGSTKVRLETRRSDRSAEC